MGAILKTFLCILLALAALNIASFYQLAEPEAVSYGQFLDWVKQGQVDVVTFHGNRLSAQSTDHGQFSVVNPETDYSALIRLLQQHRVAIEPSQPGSSMSLELLVPALFPFINLLMLGLAVMFVLTGLSYLDRFFRDGTR